MFDRALLTAVALVGIPLLRWLLIRYVRKRAHIMQARDRRAMSLIHHSAILLSLLLLLATWLPQIQHFALSITAIAVALVVATKELLLCLIGALIIRTSGAFVIGDWISMDDKFGEVIERNLLTTTLQEIENRTFSYTGRTITLPNSLVLITMVRNQNFLRRYQFHSFVITIEPDAFPIDAEPQLQERMNATVEPFAETARRYNAMLEKRTGIDIPDARPSIEFSTNEQAKLTTRITMFCPTERIIELEQAMMREFFQWYRNNRDGQEASVTGRRSRP